MSAWRSRSHRRRPCRQQRAQRLYFLWEFYPPAERPLVSCQELLTDPFPETMRQAVSGSPTTAILSGFTPSGVNFDLHLEGFHPDDSPLNRPWKAQPNNVLFCYALPLYSQSALAINQSPRKRKASSRYGSGASIWRTLIAGTMIDQGRYYAAVGALRRPRAALIPRLPPARLFSGLTSFWPDCRRDFSSVLHDVLSFCLPFNQEYSCSLTFPPMVAARRQVCLAWMSCVASLPVWFPKSWLCTELHTISFAP